MQDKILIVDDEQEIADLVSLYLTNEGFQVFKFYNAADAWSCIQTENLDLAILDFLKISPIPFTRILRKSKSSI